MGLFDGIVGDLVSGVASGIVSGASGGSSGSSGSSGSTTIVAPDLILNKMMDVPPKLGGETKVAKTTGMPTLPTGESIDNDPAALTQSWIKALDL